MIVSCRVLVLPVLVEKKAEVESSDIIDQHSSHSSLPAHTSTIGRDRHPVAWSHCNLLLTQHNQQGTDVLLCFMKVIYPGTFISFHLCLCVHVFTQRLT